MRLDGKAALVTGSVTKGDRNTGTKGSVNDRPCKNCGVVREHKQTTDKCPPDVYCFECARTACPTNRRLRMYCNEDDWEQVAREKAEGGARGNNSKVAAAEERVAAKLEDKQRPTQSEIDAEYDKLWGQIKGGRPAEGGLFWRRLCGLVCLCNCAICLLAFFYSPTVFMVFCYLCGCIPAKTGDVVAIPKIYIEWAVAVVTLMDKQYPGRRDPYAFCGYMIITSSATTSTRWARRPRTTRRARMMARWRRRMMQRPRTTTRATTTAMATTATATTTITTGTTTARATTATATRTSRTARPAGRCSPPERWRRSSRSSRSRLYLPSHSCPPSRRVAGAGSPSP